MDWWMDCICLGEDGSDGEELTSCPTSSNDSGPTRMIQVDAAPRSWPLYWDLEKHFKIHRYKMV